jgi:hypothetical protein
MQECGNAEMQEMQEMQEAFAVEFNLELPITVAPAQPKCELQEAEKSERAQDAGMRKCRKCRKPSLLNSTWSCQLHWHTPCRKMQVAGMQDRKTVAQ